MILAVRLPAQATVYASHARYLELRERTSYAFALVSAAVALEVAGCDPLGAHCPWRRRREALARARSGNLTRELAPTPEAFAKAAELALADARQSGDNGLQDFVAREHRGSRPCARARWHTERHAGAAGLSFSATLGTSHAG